MEVRVVKRRLELAVRGQLADCCRTGWCEVQEVGTCRGDRAISSPQAR